MPQRKVRVDADQIELLPEIHELVLIEVRRIGELPPVNLPNALDEPDPAAPEQAPAGVLT